MKCCAFAAPSGKRGAERAPGATWTERNSKIKYNVCEDALEGNRDFFLGGWGSVRKKSKERGMPRPSRRRSKGKRSKSGKRRTSYKKGERRFRGEGYRESMISQFNVLAFLKKQTKTSLNVICENARKKYEGDHLYISYKLKSEYDSSEWNCFHIFTRNEPICFAAYKFNTSVIELMSFECEGKGKEFYNFCEEKSKEYIIGEKRFPYKRVELSDFSQKDGFMLTELRKGQGKESWWEERGFQYCVSPKVLDEKKLKDWATSVKTWLSSASEEGTQRKPNMFPPDNSIEFKDRRMYKKFENMGDT